MSRYNCTLAREVNECLLDWNLLLIFWGNSSNTQCHFLPHIKRPFYYYKKVTFGFSILKKTTFANI